MDFFGQKTPSYDTIMLLKVVFDKTVFVEFKISNNFKQNIDETHSKQPKLPLKIHTSKRIFKTSKKNARPRSLETFAKSLWFPKRKPYPRAVLRIRIRIRIRIHRIHVFLGLPDPDPDPLVRAVDPDPDPAVDPDPDPSLIMQKE